MNVVVLLANLLHWRDLLVRFVQDYCELFRIYLPGNDVNKGPECIPLGVAAMLQVAVLDFLANAGLLCFDLVSELYAFFYACIGLHLFYFSDALP